MGLSFPIYNRAGEFQRHVVAHRGAEAPLVWNDVSTSFFVLDDDDPALPAILEPGARARVLFDGREECRGLITATPGAGPEGHVTVYVSDDMRKFRQWLGWQKPTAGIKLQDVDHRRYTGSVESVVKTAIQETITRLGVPWTVRPSLGRGGTTTVDFRMDYLADLLFPELRRARLGLVLTYNGNTPSVDVRTPNTVGGVLDPSSGRVDSFDFSRRAPSATRAVIGGRGEGAAREFDLVIDAAREADWNDIVEVFVDARNVEIGDDLKPDGQKALAEGAAQTSVSMEITEQPGFTLHETYELGDILPVRIGDLSSSEVITNVTIKDDPDDGVTVTPAVGEIARDGLQRLSNQLARLQARTRTLGRR